MKGLELFLLLLFGFTSISAVHGVNFYRGEGIDDVPEKLAQIYKIECANEFDNIVKDKGMSKDVQVKRGCLTIVAMMNQWKKKEEEKKLKKI